MTGGKYFSLRIRRSGVRISLGALRKFADFAVARLRPVSQNRGSVSREPRRAPAVYYLTLRWGSPRRMRDGKSVMLWAKRLYVTGVRLWASIALRPAPPEAFPEPSERPRRPRP